jgi:hypothetical protein
VLAQAQIEACAAVPLDADLAAREGQVDGRVQGLGVADLADGLQRRGQVRTVIGSTGVRVATWLRRAGAAASVRK